ncbi:MAG: biotin--[acetyl-CoA-carboxylase] ligase [Euryarchaeota archaeon]|nr:biotin--[acetyl-CoA-carboxylase] ligase [Euryarchaeota archaeon]
MPRSITYSVVDSTQEVALRLAREGAPHGTSVSAETQLLGRGREGRAWASPKGGLYASVVLRPEASAFPLLSLSAGLELRELLAERAPKAKVMIKWPNDLLLVPRDAPGSARKVGGVLTDIITRPGITTVAVVGVGLNVDVAVSDLPPDLQRQVASLREFTPGPVSVRDLQEPVLHAVVRACQRVSTSEGRASLPQAVAKHLFGVGSPVALEGARGTFRGVGPGGEALVEPEGGGPPRALHAGELKIEVP